MEVLLCKTKKNVETNGYEKDRSLRSEKKLKRNEITLTETRKKLKREKKPLASPDIYLLKFCCKHVVYYCSSGLFMLVCSFCL